MRHFFSVDAKGVILGASTYPGGYCDDHDLADPECTHPVAARHRRSAKSIPGFNRYVEYVCGCPDSEKHCQCPYLKQSEAYAEGSTLVDKALLAVLIDGVPTVNLFPDDIERAPGTAVTLQLQASVPDGHQVTLKPGGSAAVMRGEVVLTFTGGLTQEISLVTPALGTRGAVQGASKYVRQFGIQLRGWV